MSKRFLTPIDLTNTVASAGTVVDAPARAIQWDYGDGTLQVGLDGGNIKLSVGQEQVAKIYNGTGSALGTGQVVYITGAQGQRPSVALSSASIETTSTKTFAVIAESIPNGSEGFATTFGIVKNVNTSSFSSGAALWLSVTPGALTASAPITPNHSVFIGYVIKSSETSGEIFVNIQNGYEIGELHDVLITSPTASQVLIYNSASSIWVNATVNSVASATVSASSNISSLTSQTNFTTLTLSGSTVATQAWVLSQGYSTGGGGSSASTGTGSAVYNTSPNLLGTVTASSLSMTGNLTASTGVSVFGSASAQSLFIRNSSSTTSNAAFHALLTSTNQPAFRFDGKSTDGSTDDSNGIGLYLTHNETGNRQFAIASTDNKLGVRFLGNTIDGWLNNNRTELYIGNNTAGVYLLSAGNSIPTRRFSISNYTGASTSIVSVIQGASFQTADLTRWIDVAGNTLAYIDASGNASFPSASISGSSVATEDWVDSRYEPKLSFTYSTAGTTNNSTTNFVKPTGFKDTLITANKFYEFEIVLLIDVSTNLAVSHLLQYATASFGSVAVISGTNTTQFSNIGSTDTLASSSAIIAVTTAINSGVVDAPTILKGFIVPSVSGSFGYGGFRVGAAGTASVMANSFIKVSEVTPT